MRTFAHYADRDPQRPAVIDVDGTVVTYGGLRRDADLLAHGLLAAGARHGGTIAALLPNSRYVLLAERAVTGLPLYFTPVNWHLTPGEIAYIVTDSGASMLLTVDALLETALAAADEAGVPRDRIVVLDATGPGPHGTSSWDDVTAGAPDGPPPGAAAGQRMLYTSGTTGRPKGVRRPLTGQSPEQAAVATVARAELYHAAHEDGRYLSVAPLYHAAPLAYAVQCLDVGHSVRILPRWDALEALRAIHHDRVTWMYVVPLMLSQWLALDPEVRDAHDVSSLRSVLHTAAPCPVPVKQAAIEWLGPVLNEVYGGTEGSATFIDSVEWLARPGSVGRARRNVSLKIVDDDGRELPAGDIGRVVFANTTLSFEYHGDPAKTAASTVDGHTGLGDIGYLDDAGYLFLCDRGADVIISGGVNIYPAEIEQELVSHPDVVDALVVGAPDDEWGERVHAVVALHPRAAGQEPAADDLREFLRGRLAGFKVPRTVEFREELPRSDAGKLLRRVVREQLWQHREQRI